MYKHLLEASDDKRDKAHAISFLGSLPILGR